MIKLNSLICYFLCRAVCLFDDYIYKHLCPGSLKKASLYLTVNSSKHDALVRNEIGNLINLRHFFTSAVFDTSILFTPGSFKRVLRYHLIYEPSWNRKNILRVVWTFKWSGSFFLSHNKSFRWYLGDYEKYNFFPFEGQWEEKFWFLCVLTDV